jgi:DNA-binding transcriptional LysR family regulator
MERRQLEYFLAVVQYGGFTSAGRRLRVAQPSLSQAIRTLERDLGAPLFHRVGHGVTLTPAGEALVRPAHQVLRDLATARSSVENVSGLMGGRLDIVALTTLAVDPLADFVGRFRTLYPLVDVRITDPEHDSAVAGMVRSGESELGLTEGQGDLDGLRSLQLEAQEYLAVLPPDYEPPRSAPLSVSELAAMPLVATPNGTAMRSLVDHALTVRGKPPRVAVETTHRAAIVPLVLAGAGASLLPRAIAEDAGRRGAVVTITSPRLVRTVRLMWRNQPLSPAAAAFVNLANPTRTSDTGMS